MDERTKKIRSELSTIVLLSIAAILAFAIVAGTIWAFASGKARPGQGNSGISSRSLFDRGEGNPSPDDIIASDNAGKTSIFAEIGMLRAKTADTSAVTIVIAPFFPYKTDDIAFREELVQKTRILRLDILGWFGAHTFSEIREIGEIGVKQALLDVMNDHLALGTIEFLYFNDYMVLN